MGSHIHREPTEWPHVSFHQLHQKDFFIIKEMLKGGFVYTLTADGGSEIDGRSKLSQYN